MIGRRSVLLAACAVPFGFAQGAAQPQMISGQLVQRNGETLLQTEKGLVPVSGDTPTDKILHDGRLNGRVFEAKGHFTGTSGFLIDPIETRPMVVRDGAKRFRVTYYCDVCSIRTYSPGPCMCCQAETRLDLIDPASNE